MIFVTTGTQEPFDRLITAMDKIAPLLSSYEIVAQVAKSQYRAKNLNCYDFLSPNEFNSFFQQASLIVSHAGMGTIISALVQEKPILILPRLAKHGEHRNDHQLATAKAFEKLGFVHAAYNEKELTSKLMLLLGNESESLHKIGDFASERLLLSLSNFVNGQASTYTEIKHRKEIYVRNSREYKL